MTGFKQVIIHYRLALLLTLSALLRLLLAAFIELGNDEVYYINYALFPDLSHFDHPPMVGWFIGLFTFNLSLNDELWIRMGSIVAGTISTLLIFKIGKQVGDEITGWYSALLYNFSVYGFIITGMFIMPDSPQMLFWLLTLWLFLNGTITGEKYSGLYLLISGLTLGLALLSKYTSAFLIFGMFLYFIKNPRYFKSWHVYVAAILAAMVFLPVLYWNYQYNFISFTFHSDRVELTESVIKPISFVTELVGQILYNNPIYIGLLIASIAGLFTNKLNLKNDKTYLLLFVSLPMIIVFLSISLFRSTLPHWTGPAYVTLIPIAGLWLSQKTKKGREQATFPMQLKLAGAFTITLLLVAILQFSHGVFFNKGIDAKTGKRLGMKDITLDMYGWKQLGQHFESIYNEDIIKNRMNKNPVIVSHRWFPAANIDYYVARPLGVPLLTLAPLERTHKYAWITQYRGGFNLGMDAYFISSSYDFINPVDLYPAFFEEITTPDTIPIYRNSLLIEYFYVWRMYNLTKIPPNELVGKDVFLHMEKE